MRQFFVCNAAALCLLAVPVRNATAQNEELEKLMKGWEKDVRKEIEKDDKLKKLVAKHPLVLLHSRSIYFDADPDKSSYSFIYKTNDGKKHGNWSQIAFGAGSGRFSLRVCDERRDLLVDLGKTDFEKDADPKKINVTHPGLGPRERDAEEGHVYLLRVRDDIGNNYYVMLKVVAVDKRAQYMAFVWRMLPGANVAFPPPVVDPPNLPDVCRKLGKPAESLFHNCPFAVAGFDFFAASLLAIR
jgi:hypothetical protein